MSVLRFFAIFFFALTMAASASQGFQPISPEELKMTGEPLAPGAPAIILYREVNRDDSGVDTREDNYVRIKILTEEGRKYADVEIPFLKEQNDVSGVKARTIRPDGAVVNFDGKIYEKALVKRKGIRFMAKTFTLPDVQVGGIIEYSYSYDFKEKYIFDSHWILNEELFTKKAKFSLRPYEPRYENWNVRW